MYDLYFYSTIYFSPLLPQSNHFTFILCWPKKPVHVSLNQHYNGCLCRCKCINACSHTRERAPVFWQYVCVCVSAVSVFRFFGNMMRVRFWALLCVYVFVKVDVCACMFVSQAPNQWLSYNGHREDWGRHKVPNWQFTVATVGHSVSWASV